MKSLLKKITLPRAFLILLITVVVAFVIPHFVSAQVEEETNGGVISSAIQSSVFPILSYISFAIMTMAAVFLRITAMLLNTAIMGTLHISDILKQTPSIELVWKTIRDFSNIFLIFMLLYSAITMILGVESGSYKFGTLIKGIFIAGLLINFSLFFTKLAVDFSNVIALTFYHAIDAAGHGAVGIDALSGLQSLSTTSSSGLANSFMQGLKIQSIYDAAFKPLAGNQFGSGAEFKIVMAGVMGAVVMFFAGLSFLAAAVMFLARIVILLLLMAFSPLYVIGMALPAVKPEVSRWMSTLVGQCLFAPVYLMFMYVILRIVTDPGFNAFMGGPSTFIQDLSSGKTVGTILQYVMVIIMINVGLATSAGMAGEAGKVGMKAHGWAKKKLGGVSGYAGRQILGRAAANLDERWANSKFGNGNSAIGRSLREITTGAAANYKYGGTKTFADDKKLGKEIKTKGRELDIKRELKTAVDKNNPAGIKIALDKMTDTEISKLDKDILKNKDVIKTVSGKVYSQVDKSDRSDGEKQEIQKVRKDVIFETIAGGNILEVTKILKTLDKEESADIIESALSEEMKKVAAGGAVNKDLIRTLMKKLKGDQIVDMDETLIKDRNVAPHLSESQLKDMEGLPPGVKQVIGNHVSADMSSLGYDYVIRNLARWS